MLVSAQKSEHLMSTMVLVICLIFIVLLTNLPKSVYRKEGFLLKISRELRERNIQSLKGNNERDQRTYELSKMELNVLNWFELYITQEKLQEMKFFEKVEDDHFKISSKINMTYTQICVNHLRSSSKVTGLDVYNGTLNKEKTRDLVNSSIPIMCRILTGDLGALFISFELSQYFSVVLLNQLDLFIETVFPSLLKNIRQGLSVAASNNVLGDLIYVNAIIVEGFYYKLKECKSDILYRPGDCLEKTEFRAYSKDYIKRTYGIDFAVLEGFFLDRWTNFRVVANSNSHFPLSSPSVVSVVLEHVMFRGNILIASEKNNLVIKDIFRGISPSKEATKNRCNYVNFYTVRCRRNSFVSITHPCAWDQRVEMDKQDSGNFVEGCPVPLIQMSNDDKKLIEGTVLENIGREPFGYPVFVGQTYYWSFYDRQLPRLDAL